MRNWSAFKRKVKPMAIKPSGYTLYETDRRVAIITGTSQPSKNIKTGRMLQVYILPRKLNPLEAIKTGADKVVCGDCPLRPQNRGECYVRVEQAPNSIWKKFQRGGYPFLTDYSVLKGERIRFGAYGDPFYVPLIVWGQLARVAAGFTGYTHQWRNPLARGLMPYVMASCDTAEDQIIATSMGWRTFRTKRPENPLFVDEIVCPAAAESGHKATCEKCLLCCGTSKGRLKNITINAHGKRASNFGLA